MRPFVFFLDVFWPRSSPSSDFPLTVVPVLSSLPSVVTPAGSPAQCPFVVPRLSLASCARANAHVRRTTTVPPRRAPTRRKRPLRLRRPACARIRSACSCPAIPPSYRPLALGPPPPSCADDLATIARRPPPFNSLFSLLPPSSVVGPPRSPLSSSNDDGGVSRAN